ncbi:hypothetical protein ACJRO7_012309 [Eucalyptus globulus]|uniref:Uncharacterized protein n=1 Tax=Eucalyptus globulus TaxID=34317 RepID=A0ABD3LI43_EUCGL
MLDRRNGTKRQRKKKRAAGESSDEETHLEKDRDFPTARACERGVREGGEGRGGKEIQAAAVAPPPRLPSLAFFPASLEPKNEEEQGEEKERLR